METERELETRNEKPETKKWRGWLMLYAPLFIWIGVILFLGSGQGASTRTSLIIRPILEFLFPAADEQTIAFYHGFIRKFAHLTEYAILGFLGFRAFAGSGKNPAGRYLYVTAIGTVAIVALVAIADETIQSFNPERTGSPIDSLLDISGGVIGAFVYFLTTRRHRTSSPIV